MQDKTQLPMELEHHQLKVSCLTSLRTCLYPPSMQPALGGAKNLTSTTKTPSWAARAMLLESPKMTPTSLLIQVKRDLDHDSSMLTSLQTTPNQLQTTQKLATTRHPCIPSLLTQTEEHRKRVVLN